MGYKNKQTGFTIVELLIVIVVIGILAAITLVAFGGIRDRANDSAVQSDVKTVGALLQQHLLIHETLPTSLNAATLRALGTISPSKGAYGNHHTSSGNSYNFLYCRNTSNHFAIVAASTSGKVYRFSSAEGGVKEHGFPLTGSATVCPDANVSGPNVWWGYNTSSIAIGWVI